jgi:hypothetical protein
MEPPPPCCNETPASILMQSPLMYIGNLRSLIQRNQNPNRHQQAANERIRISAEGDSMRNSLTRSRSGKAMVAALPRTKAVLQTISNRQWSDVPVVSENRLAGPYRPRMAAAPGANFPNRLYKCRSGHSSATNKKITASDSGRLPRSHASWSGRRALLRRRPR